MKLRDYVLIRVLLSIPMILILLSVVFLILRVIPGDPVVAILGPKAPPEQVEELREKLGLNDPIYVQYFKYLGGLIRGNLGESILTGRSVSEEILERFPATLELSIVSMTIASLLGVFLGVESSRRRNSPVDVSIRVYSLAIYSIPIFWLGLMFQLIFGKYLGVLPISGRISPLMEPERITGLYLVDSILELNLRAFLDSIEHLILPSLTLGLVLSGVVVRMTRANMLEVLEKDFILASRARGVVERRVIYKDALKNALIPVITMMGLQFALLMGGAVLTETTFSWPGIGSYLIMRIGYRDFSAVQGAIVFYAILVASISVLVDIICAYIDPRVRY